jgi:hypothetical protein
MSSAKLRVRGVDMVRLLRLPADTVALAVVVVVNHPDIPEGTESVSPLYRSKHNGPRAMLDWNPTPAREPGNDE